MFAFVLRQLHLPVALVFPIVFVPYIFWAGLTMANGYVREITGWRHPGRPSKMHQVLYNWHTGGHFHPNRTYGDEHWRARSSGGGSRPVYFHPWKRWQRALRNNTISVLILLYVCGMVIDPRTTVISVTLLALFGVMAWLALVINHKRQKIRRSRPQAAPAISMTNKAKNVLLHDHLTEGSRPALIEEQKPQLTGVPPAVLANLLSGRMNCSPDEITHRLTLKPEEGRLVLPDSFGALVREREPVEEIIEAHTDGRIGFSWKTTMTPRTLLWHPVVEQRLPTAVRFRDYLDAIEALGPREFGVGVEADRSLYESTHNGDNPWHCRFAGSGTGKSMGFLVKAAQVCHRDPLAEVYCIDTKQVSFEHLRGIPGVHIYDNPQSEMDKIWGVFGVLSGIMKGRYTAMREKRARPSDFNDIWVFVDEGNDLGGNLKSYWKNVMGETSASPSIWGENVGPLLRQGRQVNIFGEWMFQDLTDRAMGGESLKMAFSVFGAAGFLPGQFTRTIGPPAPECLEGPGKILMCKGNKRTWVQGFYDDEDWLHEYALANRKGRKS